MIDGSSKDKKIEKGYTVTEILALTEKNNTPTSVYSQIFSNISYDYKSDNTEAKKALDMVYNSYGLIGTVVADRDMMIKRGLNIFKIKIGSLLFEIKIIELLYTMAKNTKSKILKINIKEK